MKNINFQQQCILSQFRELENKETTTINGGSEFSESVAYFTGWLIGSYAKILKSHHDDGTPYTSALGRGV
jgi:hypothetical protein